MASVNDFIEAGREIERQAAKNPIITTQPITEWFDEIADKLERDEAVSAMTQDYNGSLVDGEESMTEEEMAEHLAEKGVINASERECKGCYHYLRDYDEKHVLCLEYADHDAEAQIVHNCSASMCAGFRIKIDAQEKKYTDFDMMLKDAEIARLTQRVDYLEKHINRLRSQGYGINWKILREARGE